MKRNPTHESDLGHKEKEIQVEVLEQTPVDKRQRRKGRVRWLLLAALSIIGLLMLGLGFGFRYWQDLQSTMNRLDTEISGAGQRQAEYQAQLDGMRQVLELQQKQLADASARLAAQESQQEQRQRELQQQRVEIRQALHAAQGRIEPDQADWSAAEAEYLVRFANERLQLVGDVGTAIRALEAAARRLADTSGSVWAEVREILVADIGRLREVRQPDPGALATRLFQLEREVLGLRPVAAQDAAVKPESEPQGSRPLEERNLKTLLRDGMEGLKSVLVIRQHERPLRIGLPPEQQYFVYQNLRLQLAAARLALLRADQAAYQASLQSVAQWVREFFDPDSAAARAVLTEIAELKRIELRPELPDISASLDALRVLPAVDSGGATE